VATYIIKEGRKHIRDWRSEGTKGGERETGRQVYRIKKKRGQLLERELLGRKYEREGYQL